MPQKSNCEKIPGLAEMPPGCQNQIPIWEQYTLTVEEASLYYRIGENKLRRIINENRDADFVLWNGSRPQIKRKLFERYIDHCNAI